MRIAVTGSIATDHLMSFPGRFTDQLIADQLDQVSLSFLVDRLDVRRGGVAANIAFGLARLGLTPHLIGAAGVDFAEYGAWLRAAGVDTDSVRISRTLHTARFVCTTDEVQNQIATFYAGAMADASKIDLAAVAARCGGFDLVHVGADAPEAMLRHTETVRRAGVSLAADPSQQLARLDETQARHLVDRAHLLFTNEYEAALLRERTGWSERDILLRVGTWIITRGADGVSLSRCGQPRVDVPAVTTAKIADPTGVGDAFRSGFLAGLSWDWPDERAAQLGCALASIVLETVGTQEYKLPAVDLVDRVERTYGHDAAREMEPRLAGLS
ncbi:carbohydrate kinase family protein [Streptomyces sp. AC555_RSS877]|uniref:carbohydrate kinase family protein n=1 Tax=Streptomyces sp. AC555_RSS877 TaxID=2823688 RepID=UPI001C2768DB|nr:carbohydrate kinase family protein [Streptomyces sp. AC555_RSS877]